MPYHVLEIQKPSANALSKMRRGKPVRISAGSGFPVVVNSDRLNEIGKKFARGAKHTLAMTEDELKKNYEHISGNGIFGKKFDKTLEKHGLKKAAYHLADMAKPMVKGGIDTLAGMAAVAQPELAPLAMGAAYFANDYLDHPDAYTQESVKQQAKSQAENYLNDQFNTNYGNYETAAMNALAANSLQSQINAQNAQLASNQFMAPLITSNVNGPQALQSIMSVPSVMTPVANTRPVRGHGLYVSDSIGGDGLYVSGAAQGDGLYAGMSGGALTHRLLKSGRKKFPGQSLPSKKHGKIHDKNGPDGQNVLLYNTQATSYQPYMEFFTQSNFVPASARKFRNTVMNSLA